jgi:hypothetical protein
VSENKSVVPASAKPVARVETHPLLLPAEQWARLKELADHAHKSGLLPRHIDSPQKAFVIIMKGHELGLPPMYSLERLAVINGKATMDGQSMAALILSREPEATVDLVTPEGKESEMASWDMARPGKKVKRFTFTMEDATRADLLGKDPWKKYPRAMLRWRAFSEGARTVFPHIIGGLMPHEEMGAVVDDEGNLVAIEEKRLKQAKEVTPERPLIQPVTIISTDGPKLAAAKSLEERVAHANELLVKHGAPPMPEETPRVVEPAKPTPQSAGPHTTGTVVPGLYDEPPITLPPRLVTEKQVNRLMAIARAKNWPKIEVKKYCEGNFGKSMGSELTRDEYDKVCDFIMSHPIDDGGFSESQGEQP